MKNKKGQGINGIIILAFVLGLILLVGLVMVIGSAVTNFVADEVVPPLSNLGVIGSANLTEVSQYTIQPANTLIQSLTWLTGVIYVIMILGSFGLAFAFRGEASGWLIGFYFLVVILLIGLAIFVSNIYQDFYQSDNDLGSIMQEHTLISYMILYAPMIYAIIGFIAGIILFSGGNTENGSTYV